MFGEDPENLFETFPVLFGQFEFTSRRVDIIFPIGEAR